MLPQLHDEYGRPSNLEYVCASNNLANLKKDEKTAINDHINKFEQLVYEVNYNKPSDMKNMEESVINLKFLNTLMVDNASSEKMGDIHQRQRPPTRDHVHPITLC